MTAPAIVSVGTDSYISVSDADTFNANMLFNEAWQSAPAERRAQALRTATVLLDNLGWHGRKVAPTQPLQWPRVNARCEYGYPLTTSIPTAIANACAHWAAQLLASGELPDTKVQSNMLGDAMVTYFPTVSDELPIGVRKLIAPFLRVRSANVAEVVL